MTRERTWMLCGLLCLGAAACAATSVARGTVVMALNTDTANVSLGARDVRPGDRVALYRLVCPVHSPKGDGGTGTCRKVPLGTATVTRAINDRYSAIQAGPGAVMEEGAVVEKLPAVSMTRPAGIPCVCGSTGR
jgi:hypothetical protein